MEENIQKIEKLINRCDRCGLYECINCEISWADVQAIKSLMKRI